MAFKSNDLYTTNRYFEHNPTWDDESTEWKAREIHTLLSSNNISPATVVEVGCGGGGVLSALSAINPSIQSLTGFDISGTAISIAKEKESDKIKFFNDDLLQSEQLPTNVLLVIDVIEHIDDFYGFLNNIKNRSNYFVFHVPLDLSCRNILKPHTLSVQRKNVGHIHYFTKEIFEMALQDTGYEIIDFVFTKPTTDRVPVKGFKSNVKKFLRTISFKINRDLSAKLWGGYSILILAK